MSRFFFGFFVGFLTRITVPPFRPFFFFYCVVVNTNNDAGETSTISMRGALGMLFSAMMSAGILATSLLGWLVNNNTIDLIIASILDYWLLLLRFDQIDVEIWSATKKKQRRLELFCGSLNLRAYFLAFGRVLFSIGCDDRTGAGFRPSAPFSLCWFSSESSSCRTRHTF